MSDDPFPEFESVRDYLRAVEDGHLGFKQYQADGTVVFDATPYVRELVSINGGADHWTEATTDRATIYLRGGREPARRVGRVIYEAHGHEGMVAVFDFMARILPRPGGPRELEYAWDGIGEWRA